MYELTPKMRQHLKGDLQKYHSLFDGGRCETWEMEELIVRAIRADTRARHLPRWTERGHDDLADIMIGIADGEDAALQIKSGQYKPKKEPKHLVLSGNRLGRFANKDGGQMDFRAMTRYLNDACADILSVSYRCVEDDDGRHHLYRLNYVPVDCLRGIDPGKWERQGAQCRQRNAQGVEFSLRPSMSWQVWWTVPLHLVEAIDEMEIT